MCSVDDISGFCGFASGSSDKTVKLWRATPETFDIIQSQVLYDSA